MNNDDVYKVVVVGETCVGKTAILTRLLTDSFESEGQPTIGVEFKTYNTLVDGESRRLQIWDTAGQERFRSVSRAYFRNAVGALFVFDLTSRKSFEGITLWLNDFQKLGYPNAVRYLVGNKVDLEEKRAVGMQEANDFAVENKMEYIETSAATGCNINDLFLRMAYKINSEIKSGRLIMPTPYSTDAMQTPKSEEKSKGCC